jgi:hypothetical protein
MKDENVAAKHLALKLGGVVLGRVTFPDGVARDVFAFTEPPCRPDVV